jgi:hypothetical protein
MEMGRPKTYTIDELIETLASIEKKYGYIGIDTMKKARDDDPFTFPSYKMFERRLGGMKIIADPEFRKTKIMPLLDKKS